MGTRLTFLKPISPYPTFTAKAFRLENGKPTKVNDYLLGKHFSVHMAEIADLGDLHFELSDRADGFVRINGMPGPEIDLASTPRQNVFFPEGESDLLMLDLDNWKTDFPWEFTAPSVHATVRRLLLHEGFDYLLDTQYVCLLTSSQFDHKSFRAHLYFLLDAPIHIARLREWTEALKTLRGWKVFDPATQRSVQPDYISRRKCIDFPDPLPEDARLSHCSTGAPRLSTALLDEHIARLIGQAGFTPGQSHLPPLGKNWLETLAQCGNPDINGPAFRAAAQLAQEIGQGALTTKIDHYAQLMHDAAWEAIVHHAAPHRSQAEDRKTYGVSRFKQYLTSAATKPFGKGVDELKATIQLAIDSGSLAGLYDQQVIDAAAKLKAQHLGAYAEIRKALKAAGITALGEYEKLFASANGKTATGTPQDETTDADWFEKTLDTFDWLEDHLGTKYAGWNHPEDGRYRLAPIDTPLISLLNFQGGRVSEKQTSNSFGKNCMQFLVGEESMNAGGPSSRFKKQDIGVRVAPEGGPNGKARYTWIYLGQQVDDTYRALRIGPGSVEVLPGSECPVRWRDNEQALPIDWPDTDRFADIATLKAWTLKRLFDFVPMPPEQQPVLVGILFSILSGRGTSPVVEFVGPPGSGKSTASDLILDLIDPIKGGLTDGAGRSNLHSIQPNQLINVVSARYMTVFDNVSKLDRNWQDALCQVATGSSKDERILYVGSYFKIYAKRPILLTALDSVVTRPDLVSRREVFQFSGSTIFPIDPMDMIEQWLEDRPHLFKGLVYLLADALQDMATQKRVTGGDSRRRWFSLADSLFYNRDEIEEVVATRDYDRARAQFDGSEFCLGLSAWLQSLPDHEIVETSRHLLDAYRDWIFSKAGLILTIRSQGEDIRWTCVPSKCVPETPAGFGWNINQFAGIIKQIIGWEIDELLKRKKGSRKRRMHRELTEDDL